MSNSPYLISSPKPNRKDNSYQRLYPTVITTQQQNDKDDTVNSNNNNNSTVVITSLYKDGASNQFIDELMVVGERRDQRYHHNESILMGSNTPPLEQQHLLQDQPRSHSNSTTALISTPLNKNSLYGSPMISSIQDVDNLQITDYQLDDDTPPNLRFISSIVYCTWLAASIVLAIEKQNIFIQFHAFQSYIVGMIVMALQFILIWTPLGSIILWSLYLIFIIFMIINVNLNVQNQKLFHLPWIGEFCEKKAKSRCLNYQIMMNQLSIDVEGVI